MSNVPRGMNFAVLGYSYSRGNILMDPAIPVEGLDSKLHSFVAGYVRSVGLFRRTAKIDAVLPFAAGDWNATLDGRDTTRVIDGFGDPRIRIFWNSFGSPALSGSQFRLFREGTVVGIGLQMTIPVGQYDNTKLINLGTNRWSFRPQLGVSRALGPWLIEGYASAWFFTKNPDFLEGNTLTQKPLVGGAIHLVRLFPGGFWIAADVAYGTGGRTAINDVSRDTRISSFRFGLTGAIPLAAQHSIKISLASAARIERGPDFDIVIVSYQFRWGGG